MRERIVEGNLARDEVRDFAGPTVMLAEDDRLGAGIALDKDIVRLRREEKRDRRRERRFPRRRPGDGRADEEDAGHELIYFELMRKPLCDVAILQREWAAAFRRQHVTE